VPIQRVGNLLIVGATLNGSREARLILDTGASHTIVSPNVAREMGLFSDSLSTSVTVKTAGGPVQAEVLTLAAIRVGQAEAQNVPVGVFEIPDAPAGVDGLLGLTFLSRFLVTIDPDRGELSLRARQ
jgi:clan AA aspartic protease (TIGR02281 family)